MPTPGEYQTVQARILGYAEGIGWTFVSREVADQRRGFDPEVPPTDRQEPFALLRRSARRQGAGIQSALRGRVARTVPPSPHRHLRLPGRAH